MLKKLCCYETLREKCPNTEFFSCPNTGKYIPEKTRCLDTFHTVKLSGVISSNRLKKDKNKHTIVVDIK